MLYIATVYVPDSHRELKDLASFVGFTTQEAYEKAIHAKRIWESQRAEEGKPARGYRIIVGTLTAEAVVGTSGVELKNF